MAKKVVLLTGASGNVGKATLQALGKYANSLEVKAGTRDPVKNAGLKDLAPNVTVVAADGPTLPPALAGVDYVFAIAPGAKDRAEVVEGVIAQAVAAKVKFILVLSVTTADLTDTIFGSQFTKVEKATKASGLPYAIIRAPAFLDNIWGHLPTIKSQSAFYGADVADGLHINVSCAEIGEVAAKILSDPSPHANKTYDIGTPPFTNDDVALAFTASLGRPIKFVQVPYEAQKQALLAFLQDWQCDGVNELSKLINEKSPVISTPKAAQDVEAILGRPAQTVQDWVNAVAPAFQ
eukprot:TRINITY_DN4434_c0_g1_i1.p1 TRINITY_DN4434_c0_g1~~TRINITY_DN4434_c0_g1_i1.p1  ORF type:complete len:293 (+),score=47.27 TRINITY_DN4434_c0_g1_i1:85-963(+)